MSRNPAPQRDGQKPHRSRRIVLWFAEGCVVVAVLALFLRNPFEFTALNYLYYLGQQNKWDQASEQSQKIPISYRSNPKYAQIKLEILIHLARNADADQFIRAEKARMTDQGDQAIVFQQVAGFGLVLMGRDAEAAAVFRRHGRDPLSREMARLIDDVCAANELEGKRLPMISALVAERMTFPELYRAVVEYLFARSSLQHADYGTAAQLLEQITKVYPYEFVFRREFGVAYLMAGRFDLATIQLLIAHRQLQDKSLYPLRPEDGREFEERVLNEAMKYSATGAPADFWRLLRGMAVVLPNSARLFDTPVNPHRRLPAEVWEWSALQEENCPERWAEVSSATLSTDKRALLASLENVAYATPTSPTLYLLPSEAGEASCSSRTMLQVIPISNRITGLVREGDAAFFKIPPASGRVKSGVVLFRIRGSLRQGIPGGCGVQLGMDKYWIHLEQKEKWYAVPLPLLTTEPMTMQFRFNSDWVAGYTREGDGGDRNLYVLNIAACYLRKE